MSVHESEGVALDVSQHSHAFHIGADVRAKKVTAMWVCTWSTCYVRSEHAGKSRQRRHSLSQSASSKDAGGRNGGAEAGNQSWHSLRHNALAASTPVDRATWSDQRRLSTAPIRSQSCHTAHATGFLTGLDKINVSTHSLLPRNSCHLLLGLARPRRRPPSILQTSTQTSSEAFDSRPWSALSLSSRSSLASRVWQSLPLPRLPESRYHRQEARRNGILPVPWVTTTRRETRVIVRQLTPSLYICRPPTATWCMLEG